jgi:hypothetical protein
MKREFWELKLSVLDKRINSFLQGYRQNIAVLGDDPEELSYVLENYLGQKKKNDFVYIHASTMYAGKKDFFKAVVFSLLSEYTHRVETLDNLIHIASPFLATTTEFIKDRLKKEEPPFLDALEVINKFVNESGAKCVLLLEEFLELTNFYGDCYQDFSKFIILQRNCMIILTASNSKVADRVLSGELNLLFGNFEKVFLHESSSLDNFLYLKGLLEPCVPSPLFLSFFVNIIGANAAYYDVFAGPIKNLYQPEQEDISLVKILEETLLVRETYFFQKFIKEIYLLRANCRDFTSTITLLFRLSEGYLRKQDLKSLGGYAAGELANKLQKLVDLNHIENLGNIYKMKNSLFSFWLSHVFSLYFAPPVFDPRQRRSLFRRKLMETLAIFKEEFLQDKLTKVLQLFSSFRNDMLRLGRDRYRLPSIEKTKIISYPQRDFHLLIGEGNEIVFVGIKENRAEDNDILDFIEKGTNIKGRKVRKIFICLDVVSPAARLIAKNNKLAIWDVNEFNRLLNIYNKPVLSAGSGGIRRNAVDGTDRKVDLSFADGYGA